MFQKNCWYNILLHGTILEPIFENSLEYISLLGVYWTIWSDFSNSLRTIDPDSWNEINPIFENLRCH